MVISYLEEKFIEVSFFIYLKCKFKNKKRVRQRGKKKCFSFACWFIPHISAAIGIGLEQSLATPFVFTASVGVSQAPYLPSALAGSCFEVEQLEIKLVIIWDFCVTDHNAGPSNYF